MEFREALRRRRMVRRHTGEPVPPGTAERVAAAALRAPSAGFAQGVSVILVSDRERIAAIAAACGEPANIGSGRQPWLSTAGAILAICVEPGRYRDRYAEPGKDPAALEPIPWWWVDAGASLMGVLLAAVDEGLAAGFLGGHATGGARPLLGLPEEALLVGLVTLGPGADHPPSSSLRRGRRRGAIHVDRWSETGDAEPAR